MLRQGLLALLVSAPLLFSPSGHATEDPFAEVTVKARELTPGIYMLSGSGGNIGVSAGADGLLLVDNQFAPLVGKIEAALADIQPGPVKYVINTHYHGDHIGNNAHFAQSGTVFAHDNVLRRLEKDEKLAEQDLPVVTYQDGIRFRFNNHGIRVIHLGPGHTDGDSLVWFENANVLHMGDIFFNKKFPYVDQDAGGTVQGYIERVREALSWTNASTQIIPGHGELGNRTDLQNFLTMLEASMAWAREMKGKPLEDWQSQGIPAEYKDWGWRFISEERWIQTLYQEVE